MVCGVTTLDRCLLALIVHVFQVVRVDMAWDLIGEGVSACLRTCDKEWRRKWEYEGFKEDGWTYDSKEREADVNEEIGSTTCDEEDTSRRDYC
jgi:hypothetical protein